MNERITADKKLNCFTVRPHFIMSISGMGNDDDDADADVNIIAV